MKSRSGGLATVPEPEEALVGPRPASSSVRRGARRGRSAWAAALAAVLTTTTTATILVATPAGAQAPAAPVATGLSWGSNNYGELGDGTMTARNRPVNTVGLPNLTAMSAGSSGAFSVALDELGNVWAWGTNTQGELGDGTTTPHGTPIKVPGLTRVTQVTAGGAHVLALRSDGTVWAWGDNRYGQGRGGGGPPPGPPPPPG
ncbi:hypothetical protein I6A84_14720, partial [Frankia sp. CNm7]|uniref:RCC1 domain-containing protein n=1 Tax=Frankia nepalensis TaxID=1836974 RepID=UPI001DD96C81|nr:hypothetical protein [Frankia nepalensis]